MAASTGKVARRESAAAPARRGQALVGHQRVGRFRPADLVGAHYRNGPGARHVRNAPGRAATREIQACPERTNAAPSHGSVPRSRWPVRRSPRGADRSHHRCPRRSSGGIWRLVIGHVRRSQPCAGPGKKRDLIAPIQRRPQRPRRLMAGRWRTRSDRAPAERSGCGAPPTGGRREEQRRSTIKAYYAIPWTLPPLLKSITA